MLNSTELEKFNLLINVKMSTFVGILTFISRINNIRLMPWLHLPYDEYTMPVRCTNHRFRAASAGRPCDHRTDLRASWPLRFCLPPHNDKFEKS